jgi:hypothetical protein
MHSEKIFLVNDYVVNDQLRLAALNKQLTNTAFQFKLTNTHFSLDLTAGPHTRVFQFNTDSRVFKALNKTIDQLSVILFASENKLRVISHTVAIPRADVRALFEAPGEILGELFHAGPPLTVNTDIPGGHYTGPELADLLTSKNLSVTYDKDKFSLTLGQGLYNRFTLSPYLQQLLHLKVRELTEGSYQSESPVSMNFHAYPLFVECNIIHDTFVAGKQRPVLAVVNVQNPVIYLKSKLSRNQIDWVHVKVTDNHGKNVIFSSGTTAIRLDFISG